ncbi:MAG: hypothetical protein GC191_06080 [Azospirillum sp.]|nr:hypothetical protein [Azospirillum sp.]
MAGFLEFLGFSVDLMIESVLFLGALIQGRRSFGVRRFGQELRVMALQPLPIVSTFAVCLGLILSSQAIRLLDILNIEGKVIELIVLALVRDFSPIVGGFVAGRGGLNLAVRLGSMVQRREIDALILMDISHLRFIVGPAFCVALISISALTLWCMGLSILAAGTFLFYQRGIPIAMFVGLGLTAVDWTDIWIGLAKGLIICALVFITSARNGLTIDRDADAMSRVATRTVVQSLLIIVFVQLAFSLARV